MFKLDEYLKRIGIARPNADAEGLATLIAAQQKAIPFKNTEPLLGIIPDLSPAAIFAKLVDARRGGYCFELNGLLREALTAVGFVPRPVLARVRMGAKEGGARSHLAFLVEAGGQVFLADAGFGGPGPDVPVPLDPGRTISTPLGRFRVRPDSDPGELVLERWDDTGWFALYGLDEARIIQADIDAANHVCARAGFSPFPQHLMVARMVEGGRAGLFDRNLTIGTSRREIADAAELRATLRDVFGLPDDAILSQEIWARIAPAGDAAALAA